MDDLFQLHFLPALLPSMILFSCAVSLLLDSNVLGDYQLMVNAVIFLLQHSTRLVVVIVAVVTLSMILLLCFRSFDFVDSRVHSLNENRFCWLIVERCDYSFLLCNCLCETVAPFREES